MNRFLEISEGKKNFGLLQEMCLLSFSVHLFSTLFVEGKHGFRCYSVHVFKKPGFRDRSSEKSAKPKTWTPYNTKADCFGSLDGDSKDTLF